MRTLTRTELVLAAAAGAVPALAQPTFTPLGQLPNGPYCLATGVSGDGRVVVGNATTAGGEKAVRWTRASGLVDITTPGATAHATGASFDGSVVNGIDTSQGQVHAFRWTSTTGMVEVFTPPARRGAQISDFSSDGSVIVGTLTVAGGLHAFRWTSVTGLVDLGAPPGGLLTVTRVAADGTAIVGSFVNTIAGNMDAFRWTAGSGFVGLGLASPSGIWSAADAVSGDGSVVVGTMGIPWKPPTTYAFIRTMGAGTVTLGTLTEAAGAWAISDDGSTVLGWTRGRTFIWTQATGMQDLVTLLGAAVPAGWTIDRPTALSADGHTVVGSAWFGGTIQGYVATLPGGACYANCDNSTSPPVLNVADFLCFLNRFATGDPYANCDGSTTPPILNVNDFICFQTTFAGGCS